MAGHQQPMDLIHDFVCGGIGGSKPADPEVQALCDSVKIYVEKKMGTNFDTFVAKSYRTQTVAGWNYFVKVDVGNNKFLELTIYQGHGDSQPELKKVEEWKE